MPTAINQLHNCGIWGDLGSCNFQQALLKLRRSPSRPHRFWSSSEQPSLHHSPDQMGICVSQACGFALLKHINNGARILVHGCQKRGEQSFWYISPSPSPPDSCILAWRKSASWKNMLLCLVTGCREPGAYVPKWTKESETRRSL